MKEESIGRVSFKGNKEEEHTCCSNAKQLLIRRGCRCVLAAAKKLREIVQRANRYHSAERPRAIRRTIVFYFSRRG